MFVGIFFFKSSKISYFFGIGKQDVCKLFLNWNRTKEGKMLKHFTFYQRSRLMPEKDAGFVSRRENMQRFSYNVILPVLEKNPQ